MRKVYIAAYERTPVVPINSGLEKYSEQKLVANTMERVIEKAGINAKVIDEIIIGNSKQTSTPSNCARHAQLIAKLPVEIPAFTVQRQSASAMQAIINGYVAILSSNAETMLVGGTESMSQIPIEIQDARFSFNENTKIMFDTIKEHVINSQPVTKYGKIDKQTVAENIKQKFNILDEELENYKSKLENKSQKIDCKKLVPFEIKKKKETITIDTDKYYSQVNTVAQAADGAASIIIASQDSIDQNGMKNVAEIKSYSIKAGDPKGGGMVNKSAIEDALKKANLALDDIDKIEILEDSVPLMIAYGKVLSDMGLKDIYKKVNSIPSGLITGIPWGAAGAIALCNLIDQLETSKGKYGMTIVPAEGGQTMVLIIEK